MRLSRFNAWLLVLVGVAAVAAGDLLAPDELWWGPVYLVVMCLAAWSLGWRGGQAVGLGCMGLTFAINGFDLYPYGTIELVVNLAMRFLAISIVVAVVAGMRWTYLREWWLARTDLLTGALNRQAFFELAETELATRSWRLLLYADLDGLKRINDQGGHAAGDASLAAYAAAVRASIRSDDIFARIGGDEFVVLMPVADDRAARRAAHRLHGVMNAIPCGRGVALGCSVGALVVPPGPFALEGLMRQADQLMYLAKSRGACLDIAVASAIARSDLPDGTARIPRPTPTPEPTRKALRERRRPPSSQFSPSSS